LPLGFKAGDTSRTPILRRILNTCKTLCEEFAKHSTHLPVFSSFGEHMFCQRQTEGGKKRFSKATRTFICNVKMAESPSLRNFREVYADVVVDETFPDVTAWKTHAGTLPIPFYRAWHIFAHMTLIVASQFFGREYSIALLVSHSVFLDPPIVDRAWSMIILVDVMDPSHADEQMLNVVVGIKCQ
jgi:hypothetical protein